MKITIMDIRIFDNGATNKNIKHILFLKNLHNCYLWWHYIVLIQSNKHIQNYALL